MYLSRTIQLSSGVPFVRGKTLEGAVGALLPLSKDLMKPKAALPKTDTVVSAFLLDKVRGNLPIFRPVPSGYPWCLISPLASIAHV